MSKALKIILIIFAALLFLLAALFFALRAYSARHIMDGPGMINEAYHPDDYMKPVLGFGPRYADGESDVYMEAVNFSRDDRVLTVHVVNHSNREQSFGRDFEIFRQKSGEWEKLLPLENYDVPADERVIPANSESELDFDLSAFAEPDAGLYKIFAGGLEAEYVFEWTE